MEGVECAGEHRFFVPDDGIVFLEPERRICIVIICTACGVSKLVEHNVAKQTKER